MGSSSFAGVQFGRAPGEPQEAVLVLIVEFVDVAFTELKARFGEQIRQQENVHLLVDHLLGDLVRVGEGGAGNRDEDGGLLVRKQ